MCPGQVAACEQNAPQGDEQQVIDLANANHFPVAQLISISTCTGKPFSLRSILG